MFENEVSVRDIQVLLEKNTDWINKYARHAEEILYQASKIKKAKKNFREWEPLFLYSSITYAKGKGSPRFSLRYLGQEVASITVEKEQVFMHSSDFHEHNKIYFNYQGLIVEKDIWGKDNLETRNFRSFFKKHFQYTGQGEGGTNNEEHRLESALLTELEKDERDIKCKDLHGIQPVKINDIARFQMATPLAASKTSNTSYASKDKGGGVDILCRVGSGGSTKLCVIELKQIGKTSPKDAIVQGLAYATFIRALLRSKSGQEWYEIFGFKRNLPEKNLKILVACAMPSSAKNDYSFSKQTIAFDDGTGDKLELHYMYFKEENNIITEVETSLNKS